MLLVTHPGTNRARCNAVHQARLVPGWVTVLKRVDQVNSAWAIPLSISQSEKD